MKILFAIVDLAKRWNYTKAGVHLLTKQANFPQPLTAVCHGRIKLYALSDIVIYEKDKPWLFDSNIKEQRVKGYARAIQKGERLATGNAVV